MDSFACLDEIRETLKRILQNSKKLKKPLLALKIFKSAANAISFKSETPYFSINVMKTFSQREGTNKKNRKCVVLYYY